MVGSVGAKRSLEFETSVVAKEYRQELQEFFQQQDHGPPGHLPGDIQ